MMANGMTRESDLAKDLGLPRRSLADFRKEGLEKDADWVLVESQVWLTEGGLAKTRAHFQAEGAEVSEKNSPGPERGVARVVKSPVNPRIVLAEMVTPEGEAGKAVRVRVRSNVNFLPGMEMPVYREDWDLWVLDRPCPRWRGRW